jgi:aminopeptidase N
VKKLLLSAFLISLFSCKTVPPPSTVPATSAAETTEAEKTSDAYRATYNQPVDLIHTSLDLRPDWNKKWLYGTAVIHCKPHYYPVDSVRLNARGMDILNVRVKIKGLVSDSVFYRYNGRLLDIPFDHTADRNDTITLTIRYISKPDQLKSGGSAAISDDKGLYFINADGKHPDKPTQLWTQGETE